MLSYPSVCWVPDDAKMDYTAGVQLDDDEHEYYWDAGLAAVEQSTAGGEGRFRAPFLTWSGSYRGRHCGRGDGCQAFSIGEATV